MPQGNPGPNEHERVWSETQRRLLGRLSQDLRSGSLTARGDPGRQDRPHWSSPLVVQYLSRLARDQTVHITQQIWMGVQPSTASDGDFWIDINLNQLWIWDNTTAEFRKLGNKSWFDLRVEENVRELADSTSLTASTSRITTLRASDEWPRRYMNDNLRRASPVVGPVSEAVDLTTHYITTEDVARMQSVWGESWNREWEQQWPQQDAETRRLQEQDFARRGQTGTYLLLRESGGGPAEVLAGPYSNMRWAQTDLRSLQECDYEQACGVQLFLRTFLRYEEDSGCPTCCRPRGYSHQRHCPAWSPPAVTGVVTFDIPENPNVRMNASTLGSRIEWHASSTVIDDDDDEDEPF